MATLLALATTGMAVQPHTPQQLPGPPFAASFLPMLRGVLNGQAHHETARLMREHGQNFEVRFPFPWRRWAFIHEPEMVKTLLNDVNPPKAPEFCRGIESVASGSILTAAWDDWLVQRRTTSPALSQKLVGSWTPIFEESAAPLLQALEAACDSAAPVEIDEALVSVFLTIICRITLGQRLSDAQQAALLGSIGDALDEAMRRIALPPGGRFLTALLPAGRRYRRARRRMDELVRGCVQERRDARAARAEAEEAGSTDLLDLLLDAQADGVMDEEGVRGQLLTFILAGHDTTAHTLSWLLFEVASQPQLQAALHAEVDAALPAGRLAFPAAADLREMPLLDRTWREALRKHPVAATGTLRLLQDECTLVGADGASRATLRAGTRVSVVPYALHRNERHWEAPVEAFDPDRFLPERVAARHPYALQAFSGGPRDCIGKGLARAEALAVLGALLRRFEFELAGAAAAAAAAGEAPRDHHMITRKPAEGIELRVRRRG